MARHALISTQDHAQLPGVTISGGIWKTHLPATNILTIQPQLVAMVDGSSVSFTINLGATRLVDIVHVQRLITASNSTIRVRFGTYDSNTVNAWATDSLGIYPALLYASIGRPRVFVSPTQQSTSTIVIDINSVSGYL